MEHNEAVLAYEKVITEMKSVTDAKHWNDDMNHMKNTEARKPNMTEKHSGPQRFSRGSKMGAQLRWTDRYIRKAFLQPHLLHPRSGGSVTTGVNRAECTEN